MRNVQSVMEFPTISHRLPPFLLNAGKRLREILAIKMVVTPLEKVWIIRPAAATSALAPGGPVWTQSQDESQTQSQSHPLLP